MVSIISHHCMVDGYVHVTTYIYSYLPRPDSSSAAIVSQSPMLGPPSSANIMLRVSSRLLYGACCPLLGPPASAAPMPVSKLLSTFNTEAMVGGLPCGTPPDAFGLHDFSIRAHCLAVSGCPVASVLIRRGWMHRRPA